MNILMLGGTRFFGVQTVEALLERGHTVTIATRGNVPDKFGTSVSRIIFDRTDEVKYVLDVADCDKYIHMSSTAVYNPKHWNTKEEELINYVEKKINKKAILSKAGEAAPYNNESEYSINTDKAYHLGYEFSNLKDWIYELLDYYISMNFEN